MGKPDITQFAKKWLPPVMADFLAGLVGRRVRIAGNFKNWHEVQKKGKGYAAAEILERVKLATDKVIKNRTMFERDGVVFEEKSYPFPVIATLLLAAKEFNGELVVLDFGGSLGSSYYQCKDFLTDIPALKWCVIEQEHFVTTGQKNYQTDVLRFYKGIQECYMDVTPNVALFSGVLQYLPDPEMILKPLMSKAPEYLIIDRTPIIENQCSRIALQVVPESLGKASYPIRLFVIEDLIKYTRESYRTLCTFNAIDTDLYHNGKLISYKGIIFKKSEPKQQGA